LRRCTLFKVDELPSIPKAYLAKKLESLFMTGEDVPPGWGEPGGYQRFLAWATVESRDYGRLSLRASLDQIATGLRKGLRKWINDEEKAGRLVCKTPRLGVEKFSSPVDGEEYTRIIAEVYSYDPLNIVYGIEEIHEPNEA
jgi:hypothetical protein